jgi:NADH-quinone oxidoreductase subunit M
MLLLVERVFFGKNENAANAALPDLSLREWSVLAPILALIVVMGLVPQPFLDPAKGAVDRLLARFQATEQRLQQREPGYVPATGTQPPAIATAPRIQGER